MKALLCTRHGTPDDLELADIPDPVAASGEAVVHIKAAALNFFDTLIIANKYQTKPPLPFSPAAEFSGTVESVGSDVSTVKVGDRVIGCLTHGAAREKIAAPAGKLIKIPDALDFDRAAGLCITYGTTLHALKDRAKLRAGETLAVLGASGGAGLAAVELGKLMNARVIACASSDEKLWFAKKHGADDTINYGKDDDLKDALRRITGGRGVDVIYDPIGGPYTEPALRSIAWQAGFSWSASPPAISERRSTRASKGCDVVGVFWLVDGPRSKAIARTPNSCWPGAWTENCHRTFMRSTHWRTRRQRSRPSRQGK
jgi:NADPH2:quinone reductase